MAPPRSKIWRYFSKKNNSAAQCNTCLKTMKSSGNTSNLIAHLRQKHFKIYKAVFAIKENEEKAGVAEPKGRKADTSDLEEPHPSTSSAETPASKKMSQPAQPPGLPRVPGSSSITMATSTATFSQPTITRTMKTVTSFSAGGSSNVKITNAIAYFLCKDNMPFSTVEGEGFLKLFKEVSPLYKVPTRNTFKNLIDKKFDTISTLFKEKLKSVNHITITTDIWTDIQMKSFLGVTLHYIVDVKLFSATLGVIELTESHTAQYISSEFLKVLSDWDLAIDKVVAIVTDNGANIVKAACDTFGRNKHIPCFAHTLNLVCEKCIKNTEGLDELLQKVRDIVIWFRRSVHANDRLRKQQIDNGVPEGSVKKIILDVKTRWNSTFYMLERFVEMSALVANILFENVNAPAMVSPVEILHLKEIIQLLRPLEKMTTEICGEQFITISKVIPMLRCVLEQYTAKINPSSELGQKLKLTLLAEFDKRFGQIEKSHLLATATILDPRFKKIHFKDALACSTTISRLRRDIAASPSESINPSNNSDEKDSDESDSLDLWNYHHKQLAHAKRQKTGSGTATGSYAAADDEVSQYLQSPVQPFNKDPLLIWDEIKVVFPNLYMQSQKYLGIVATSVPSERLFSKAGATASKTRNRLTGKRLSKLLFLQSTPGEHWFNG